MPQRRDTKKRGPRAGARGPRELQDRRRATYFAGVAVSVLGASIFFDFLAFLAFLSAFLSAFFSSFAAGAAGAAAGLAASSARTANEARANAASAAAIERIMRETPLVVACLQGTPVRRRSEQAPCRSVG